MGKKAYIWITTGIIILVVVAGIWQLISSEQQEVKKLEEAEKKEMEMKRARAEYFFRMLRDPVTNRIPPNIRSRELEYSKDLPSRGGDFLRRSSSVNQMNTDITWQSAGPQELGGRTRALAIDQRNSNVVLAGGVSGGVWKSTDGGDSWQMKTDPNQNMSVTGLAQDPTNPDTWYYTSGEYIGNSASDRGNTAFYYGTGIYKSTDNGETWSLLPATEDKDKSFSSRFDYLSAIQVSPTTGSVFAASNAFGLLRSSDDGSSFTTVKGGPNLHVWTDFDIDQQGNIVAVFSTKNFQSGGDPGVFYSTDDGSTWTKITPSDFPSAHGRSVITFAPSDPSIVYVFSQKENSDTNQGISFFKIDVSDPQNPVAEDRSANLPDFGDPVGGVNLQGGYNMEVAVKPDDPNFVMVGATNLFRSRDGFATKPTGGYDNADNSQKDEYWIGGYAKANNVSQYSSHHPDQHAIAFDPNDPNKVWSSHDGGLSITSDITASSVSWQDQDDGYVTGQFYTVAIPTQQDDDRIMGGTQDNGTPFFEADAQGGQQTTLTDISSGDGSYAAWGSDYAYVSSQNGKVLRIGIKSDGSLTSPYDGATSTDYSVVYPSGASNQLFIHPYVLAPSDSVMFYPGGRTMWRNTSINEITGSSGGTSQNWDSFTAVSSTNYVISTLEITQSQPSDRLYYAAYNSNQSPQIFYLDDATNTQDVVDISISGAPSGGYVHDLAVNPQDGDEVIAVISNYGVVGLYRSTDGGSNWTAIEGNLEGTSQNPGPSIRNATILPTSSGTTYLVGTSTGVYSTTSLSGSSTTWTRESDGGSAGSIGYSVAEYIVSRPSDGRIAVATHGRGIFVGQADVLQIGDGQVPAAPTGLALDVSSSDVDLSWAANSESDISKYYIYRGSDSNNLVKYDSVSASSDPSYTDQQVNNDFSYYRVSAFDTEGNESDTSTLVVGQLASSTIDNQWQLVGSPMAATSGMQSGGNITIYGYSSVYESSNSFNPQEGYWVKSDAGSNITFSGGAQTDATISLEEGWNLIGGIGDTVSTSDISDPNGVRSATDIFKYQNGSYQSATEITPTRGYWIHADQAGDIQLAISASSSSGRELLVNQTPSVDELQFRNGQVVQKFFATSKPIDNAMRDQYRMPPQAPTPALDVRTTNDLRLAEQKRTELKLTSSIYPVQVSVSQNAQSGYVLSGVTGQDTVHYQLPAGRKATIQQPHQKLLLQRGGASAITEHELLPNYPNPFNPSTKIRYKVAAQTEVTLEVYNVLGQKVRTLVNKRQTPGAYTVSFDGSNLSSGMYFIHLKAGGVSKVQKMTLLK